ncbi:hypothetical protein QTP88_004748 [Uroleucon formosanum]
MFEYCLKETDVSRTVGYNVNRHIQVSNSKRHGLLVAGIVNGKLVLVRENAIIAELYLRVHVVLLNSLLKNLYQYT